MPSVKVYKMDGSEAGEMQLSDKIFGAEYNEPLIHQAVVTRLANERQGTKSTLTRTEVRGGGAKPWRQKGTGRARQGSIRAPQWTKGGVVFAPKSRDFSKKMNVEARRGALFSALSKKVADGELIVVDKLEVSAPKTKEMVKFARGAQAGQAHRPRDGHRRRERHPRQPQHSQSEHPARGADQHLRSGRQPKVVLTKGAVEKIQEVYGA